jgi:hypothetical protein
MVFMSFLPYVECVKIGFILQTDREKIPRRYSPVLWWARRDANELGDMWIVPGESDDALLVGLDVR